MRQGVKTLAREIITHAKSGQPYSLHFIPIHLSQGDRVKLEAYLKDKFELWANTWIIPYAEEILNKGI